MNMLPVVTLDGPAGVGKSTVARLVAQALGYPYMDTGAMYRTLALHLGAGASTLSAPELRAQCMGYTFHMEGAGADTVLLCNDSPVGDEIRNENIGALASRLAAVPVVREYLQHAQRQLGDAIALVAEGRDMGSKVFVRAEHKFFLDAAPEVRAARRYKELVGRGEPCNLRELTEQIRQRDEFDRTRPVDPLGPARDAVLIDTSELSIDDVVDVVLRSVRAKSPQAVGVPVSVRLRDGRVEMVDIGTKVQSAHTAMARGVVEMAAPTMEWLQQSQNTGEVLHMARIAGIMAAKRTADLIPMCHHLSMTFADVRLEWCTAPPSVRLESEVRTLDRAGAEMEAMLAVQVAASTVYDVCRSMQKDVRIRDVRLVYASGGSRGEFDQRGSR